jgi:hypothetical protein
MHHDFYDRISYLIIDTSQYQMAQTALNYSQRLFPLANRIVFSDRPEGWDATKFIPIPKLSCIEEYNELLLTKAWKHIQTDFVQIIQWDGHVITPNAFQPRFLEVDYIGAVWPHRKTRRVGNGGFSLRSKRLMESLEDLLPEVPDWQQIPEDDLICRILGERLEREHDIQFASTIVANAYSIEWDFDEFGSAPFGFHGLAMLIAHHQENLHDLLVRLGPVSGWQLVVMSQIISTLSQKDIEEFYRYLQRHNLFDEFANHLNMKVERASQNVC